MTLRVASLFTGIGCLDLAFVKAGFEIAAQVEIDPFCRAVLAKHAPTYWPNAKVFEDVQTVTQAELGAVDVLIGGFPCQDVSHAGKRQGIAEDTRSGLWSHYARLIGELRPRIAFMENVPGLLSKDGVRVIADLARLGYDAEWCIVPASAVGAPHERKRWLCVAYPNCAVAGVEEFRASRSTREHANTHQSTFLRQGHRTAFAKRARSGGKAMGYAHRQRQQQPQRSEFGIGRRSEYDGEDVGNPMCEREAAAEFSGQPHCAIRTGEAMGDAERTRWTRRTVPAMGKAGILAQTSHRHAQSLVGRAVDGFAGGMDGHRWPAAPGEEQHEWEAPRTSQEKVPNRVNRLKALGNGVVWQMVYPFAVTIREWIEVQGG